MAGLRNPASTEYLQHTISDSPFAALDAGTLPGIKRCFFYFFPDSPESTLKAPVNNYHPDKYLSSDDKGLTAACAYSIPRTRG